MIRLASITIAGSSAAGPFSGTITFQPGLHVITANNHFGKSLAVTGIAWCLGLESMFGVKDNDPSCFPLAAHEALDLSDTTRRAKILESRAVLELVRDDGSQLRIERPIVGDPKEVSIEVRSHGEEAKSSRLMARYRGMKDETGGLQNFLFEWFSLPRVAVLTNRGMEGEVYLENIAPHFYIDQNEGWTSTQALQVLKYGLLDIAQVSVEYLLGADQALVARLNTQSLAAKETRLKGQAAVIASQVETLFVGNGWALQWSAHGNVNEIVQRWSKQTLTEIAKKRFNFDLTAEQKRLSEKADATRRLLKQEGLDPKDAAAASDASQLAINLKAERHALRESLRAARAQRTEHEQLAANLEHRMHASQDVLRLKKDGIGRMDVVECPTCSQKVDPKSFGLSVQSTEVVAAHIEALRRDRILVLENIKGVTNEITRVAARSAAVDEALRAAESALANVNAVAGSVREQLAKAAADLSAIDREMAKNHDTARQLDELQQVIDAWSLEARQAEKVDQSKGDLEKRVSAFTRALRQHLLELGHAGVRADEANLVTLDQDYVPYLETRRLRAMGSASDHARLIAAYALALATASHEVVGHHPGFVVFDEPLQQNPDPDHRQLFLKFLEKAAAMKLPYQLLIFTSLEPAEIGRLRAAGVQLDAKQGHLLNPSAEHDGAA